MKKKNIIQKILLVIIGITIGGGISVLASNYILKASDIKYNENKTVQQVVEELYSKADKIKGSNEVLPLGIVDVSGRLITIPYMGSYDKIRCIYGIDANYGSEGIISNNACTFTGTTTNQNLYYKLIASDITSDNLGKIYEISGSVVTGNTFPLSTVNVGDYIYLKPTSTSYTISSSMTGYSRSQTINPSELSVWRVIQKNSDGTVDVISDKVSSSSIAFYGWTGHTSLESSLNIIASQYTNSNFVQSTRHISQTADTRLVISAYGSLKTYNLSDAAKDYWLANTNTYYGEFEDESDNYYYGLYIDSNGTIIDNHSNYFENDDYRGEHYGTGSHAIRPILTLKSTVMITGGTGTSSDYYTLGL